MNKDNPVVIQLLFYKRKEVYCAIVYWFVSVNLTHHKFFLLMFLIPSKLLLDMFCIVIFLSCSEDFHYLVYHTKYYHSQE